MDKHNKQQKNKNNGAVKPAAQAKTSAAPEPSAVREDPAALKGKSANPPAAKKK